VVEIHNDIDIELRQLQVEKGRQLGIMLSRRCNIACPQCISRSSPHITIKEPQYDVSGLIRQAAHLSKDGVGPNILSFTGGEPFLNLKLLERYSALANDYGLLAGAITNGFWASDLKRGKNILSRLHCLCRIDVSTDFRHLQFIPFQTIENAISLLCDSGQMGEVRFARQINDEGAYNEICEILEKHDVSDRIHPSSLIYLDSKGCPVVPQYRRADRAPLGPCFAITPVIEPSGRVLGCCGCLGNLAGSHAMVVGDITQATLFEIYRSFHLNPFIQALRVGGIYEAINIFTTLLVHNWCIPWHDRESPCFTCFQFFKCMSSEDAKLVMSNSTLIARFAMLRFVLFGEEQGIDLLPTDARAVAHLCFETSQHMKQLWLG